MTITMETVSKALAGLEELLDDDVNKASDDDLDNPEGADLDSGVQSGGKLADEPNKDGGASGAQKKSPKATKSETAADDEDENKSNDDEDEMKSLRDRADAEIEAKIEVSEFLKSLHDGLNETLESMGDVIKKSAEVYDTRSNELAEQIADLQQNQAKIGVVLKAMCEHIGMIGNKRAANPKSIQKSGGQEGQPTERNFVDPAAVLEEESAKSQMWPGLSKNPVIAKSQLLTAALELAKAGKIEQTDVINLESSGHVRPEIVGLLQKSLNTSSAA